MVEFYGSLNQSLMLGRYLGLFPIFSYDKSCDNKTFIFNHNEHLFSMYCVSGTVLSA